METTTLEDFSQALKNIGSKDGVAIEVSIDKASLMKLGVIMGVVALGGVALNHLLKNI